jgi:hypothetical protein
MPDVPLNAVLPLTLQNGPVSLNTICTTVPKTSCANLNESLSETLFVDTAANGDCTFYYELVTSSCSPVQVGPTVTYTGAGSQASPDLFASNTSIDNTIFEATCPVTPVPGQQCISASGSEFSETIEYQLTVTPDGSNNIAQFNATADLTWPPGPDPVPEPSSLALLGAGVFGLGVFRRRKKAA